ncbi:MAG: sulfotransferase [Actinomycetota bacterium]|nr:sulfotransferase [Actinomycetota bacterium]
MTAPSRQTVPTFLVAGAARCGTTGLVEGLRTHSRVFVTDPKEPHYFALYGEGAHFKGPGDSGTINRATVADREAYLALYPSQHDYLALGDGSVSTMFYAERAVPEIRRVNPQMRLVVMLREPVERAYSSYLYLKARGFETEEDFLAAVADEPRRKAENWHHLWLYPAMSYYAEDLAILRSGLGVDQVGVFFYDDLQRDYAGTVRRVQDFLGLPEDPEQDLDVPRVNVSGTPRLQVLQRAIQQATGNERLRRTVKSVTSFRFRERIRRSGLKRSAVSEEIRAALAPRFTDDLAELSTMLSGPVPGWIRS